MRAARSNAVAGAPANAVTNAPSPTEAGVSQEIADNFLLERRPLCKTEYMSERMKQRLQRRLKKSAHLARPKILKSLLTEQEILEVYQYVQEIGEAFNEGNVYRPRAAPPDEQLGDEEEGEDGSEHGSDNGEVGPEPGSAEWLAEQMRLTASMSTSNYDAGYGASVDVCDDEQDVGGWVRLSDNHRKLWLHHGGPTAEAGAWETIADVCPGVVAKLLDAMHSSGMHDSTWRRTDSFHSKRPELQIRCIEFHDYVAGGGAEVGEEEKETSPQRAHIEIDIDIDAFRPPSLDSRNDSACRPRGRGPH